MQMPYIMALRARQDPALATKIAAAHELIRAAGIDTLEAFYVAWRQLSK